MESKELHNESNASTSPETEVTQSVTDQVQETENIELSTDAVAETEAVEEPVTAPEMEAAPEAEAIEATVVAETEIAAPELKLEIATAVNDEDAGNEESSEDDHDNVVNLVDYDSFSKDQLYKSLEELTADITGKKLDGEIKKIKQAFDNLADAERSEALSKFVADGGEPDDFKYRNDGLTVKFDTVYQQYREKRKTQQQAAEKQKEQNVKAKADLLEQLKALVDGEETKNSINALKKIQDEWKAIGQLPPAKQREFSASYGVLLDKYYNNRSIYFELKELDRKKNLEAKQEIIVRAEKLLTEGSINKALKELNDLHEEYKNVGPVPKDEQEKLWSKFKAISDQIYTVRREMLEKMHGEQSENLDKKVILMERLENAVRIKTDRIDNWNQQSAEVMKIREEWQAIGSVPRDKSGDLNKKFWGTIKQFFNEKIKFFKDLEEQRSTNLRAKTALCEEAEGLKEDGDWNTILDTVKDLQERWKQIGPLPFKFKNSLYERFKGAIDGVFERRRASNAGVESEYKENLKAKMDIIEKLEGYANEKTGDIDTLKTLEEEFSAIGYVPRKSIDTVQEKYKKAIESYLANSAEISDAERTKYRPAGGQRRRSDAPSGEKRENTNYNRDRAPRNDNRSNAGGPDMQLRRKISQLEDQIHQWNNNLSYFANSRNADALRKEVAGKVSLLEKELAEAKEQLKTLQQPVNN